MLFGGHVRNWNDISFLQEHDFDFGEVVVAESAKIPYLERELASRLNARTFRMVGHGPREGPPNDTAHLLEHYKPALVRSVDLMERLGAELLTIHMWMDRRFVAPEFREVKTAVLRDVCDYALDKGIVLCLENLSESADDLHVVTTAVPDLMLTLDVGHAQLLSERNTSYEIIPLLGNRIRHVHIHDNLGGVGPADDLHLPPGSGIIDLSEILNLLMAHGFQGGATLELERHELLAARSYVTDLLRERVHAAPQAVR